jgi:predicted Zn-dependent protease
MAMAGYDPEQQLLSGKEWNFFYRQQKPEFLSTHPNPQNRIADLNADMPKALQYYKAAGGKLKLF